MAQTLIVVPVLNESATLAEQLSRLSEYREQGAEVVLVDGGSADNTREMVRAAGFMLIDSERGRALQMNAGARAVSSDVLIFLHADTRLPTGALVQVEQHLRRDRQWGRFDVQITGASAWLAVIACLMNIRSRLTGIATGDQTLFMTREAFDTVGGFPVQPLMEDIEMSKRLKRLSPPVCLSARVETSGRRWEQHGVWKTILLMWRLRWAYWRGTPASELARLYR